jgi:hypothetical protein
MLGFVCPCLKRPYNPTKTGNSGKKQIAKTIAKNVYVLDKKRLIAPRLLHNEEPSVKYNISGLLNWA